MSGQSIDYETLAKEALRTVVRRVLEGVVENGLPGNHHFFISFHTTAPGVKISSRISAQYPKEMTVVLQHQFWDLKVEEDHFEVSLSFSNIPETLVIPYKAIKVFFDPAASYGLQFDQSTRREAVEDQSNFLENDWQIASENGDISMDDLNEITIITPGSATNLDDEATTVDDDVAMPDFQTASDESDGTPPKQDDEEGEDGAEIVSLDAFRKKNN